MKPEIHIFFNGEGAFFPRGNAWEKFGPGLDSVRTFAICAEAWERQGFAVRRLSTVDDRDSFTPTRFLPGGECEKSFAWYPRQYWQFIAKAKAVAAASPRKVIFFATMDVIPLGTNHGLHTAEINVPLCGYLNFQAEHFSLSTGVASHEWLGQAEDILTRYDRGELPSLCREYVSDETILRSYARYKNAAAMTFAGNTERAGFPLCHFARSTLKTCFTQYPTS
jgi:hypothetical protein